MFLTERPTQDAAVRPLAFKTILEMPNEMEDTTTQLDTALELLSSLGVEVRGEWLEGSGGGLCSVRGKRTMFVDLAADPATRLQRCIDALASIPEVDDVYVIPALREKIERTRREP